MEKPFTEKCVQRGTLYLAGVKGRVDWGVWFRFAGATAWTFWRSGFVDNTDVCGDLPAEPLPWDGPVTLGELPSLNGNKSSRQIQFLVRWAGLCSVEAVRVSWAEDTKRDDQFEAKTLGVTIGHCDRVPIDYDDYEYAELPESESWLKPTAK